LSRVDVVRPDRRVLGTFGQVGAIAVVVLAAKRSIGSSGETSSREARRASLAARFMPVEHT